MLPYLAVYMNIAVTYALIARHYGSPLFIRTNSKHLPWKINYNFRWWRGQEWWAALATISFYLYTLAYIFKFTGGTPFPKFSDSMTAITCLSSTILSIRHYKLVAKFKNNSWWLTIATASVTIFLLIAASAYSDSFIINNTRTDPSKLSLAQKAVSTAILVSIWTYIAVSLLCITVLLNCLWDIATYQAIIPALDPTTGIPIKRSDYNPSVASRHSFYKKVVVNAGAFFTLVTLSNLWGEAASQYKSGLQQLIVFSSFHLKPKDCGAQGLSSEAWIAPLEKDSAILAIPDHGGYMFLTIQCSILSKSEMKNIELKKIRGDAFF